MAVVSERAFCVRRCIFSVVWLEVSRWYCLYVIWKMRESVTLAGMLNLFPEEMAYCMPALVSSIHPLLSRNE